MTSHTWQILSFKNATEYFALNQLSGYNLPMAKKFKSILCISDMHHPYAHPDTAKFLAALKRKYRPDKIVCLGDEVDKHAMSFHDSDPDLFSAGHELCEAIRNLKPIYKLFPEMEVISSNHGDMVYRKAKHHGIPRKYLRGYGEVLEAPKGWRWHSDLVVETSIGTKVYFHHGKSADVFKASQAMSMSMVQGHYHEKFNIHYWANPTGLYWGMQIGSSVDDRSLAFTYNKTNLKRPIIGHGIILEGLPKLLPMVMDTNHKWNGFVP